MIFVFGSNEAGIHGAGSALTARLNYGAVLMQGVGRQGESYAIPTKGKIVINGQTRVGRPLPADKIKEYVDGFIRYAKENPSEEFQVTKIGTGHAGFTHEMMAPLFSDAPGNCLFDTAWEPWLPGKRFWGTY